MSQNIQAGIFSLLTANPAISALVGTRVYPIMMPEPPTLPAVRYQIVGGSSQPTFTTSGMQKLRMQFDCFGAMADDAMLLRATLIAQFNGTKTTLSDGTVLQNADLIQQIDFFDNEARQHRCMVEFYLYFDFL